MVSAPGRSQHVGNFVKLARNVTAGGFSLEIHPRATFASNSEGIHGILNSCDSFSHSLVVQVSKINRQATRQRYLRRDGDEKFLNFLSQKKLKQKEFFCSLFFCLFFLSVFELA
jgi:hypothetical protein